MTSHPSGFPGSVGQWLREDAVNPVNEQLGIRPVRRSRWDAVLGGLAVAGMAGMVGVLAKLVTGY